MVKSISHITKADKTRCSASFQVMPSAENFEYGVALTKLICILYHSKSRWRINSATIKNCSFPYLFLLADDSLYKNTAVVITVHEKKNHTDSCKINDQSKFLAEIGGGHWEWQRYTVPKGQNNSEDINVWWELYRAILDKCRYTSLELAGLPTALRSAQLAAFKAYPIANHRISNPARVGSSEHNKEQCHRLWQCQTIVDS